MPVLNVTRLKQVKGTAVSQDEDAAQGEGAPATVGAPAAAANGEEEGKREDGKSEDGQSETTEQNCELTKLVELAVLPDRRKVMKAIINFARLKDRQSTGIAEIVKVFARMLQTYHEVKLVESEANASDADHGQNDELDRDGRDTIDE